VGKNMLRGRMLILGQVIMDSEEKKVAEELINLILQKDLDFKTIKKKNAGILTEEEGYCS
jgi:phosphohistidine swiveling domain-containing protein